MNQAKVIASDLELKLSHGLDKRHRLDVSHLVHDDGTGDD